MEDDIKNITKSKNSLKELLSDRLEAYSVEQKISAELKKQSDNLGKLTGIYKTSQQSLFENLHKQFELKRDIKDTEQEIYDITEKLGATSDDATKASIKISLDGFKQRKSNLEKEYLDIMKLNKSSTGPWLYFITKSINLFETLDKAAFDFRQTVGFTRDNAYNLKRTVQDLAIQYMNIGVSADIVNKALIISGQYMGGLHNATRDVVSTISILNAQLGTAVEDSAKMLQTFAVLSGTTMEMQTNMVYFTQALSAAAGVNFNQIASDFKSMGSTTLTMVSRLPLAMAKTAVELRRMGTDINTSAEASSKLLEFTQNIQDEMAASVLLGHSFNLQKARELAYHRDIEGSTKEILRLAKENNFAHGMDTFQMQAFAAATGRSVEDLLNMVQVSEQLDSSLRSTDPIVRSMAENYQRLRAANEASAAATGKDVAYQLMLKSNQERMIAINQKWAQVMAQVGQIFLPIIDGFLSAVIPTIDIGKGLLNWVIALKSLDIVTSAFKYLPLVGSFINNMAIKTKVFGVALMESFGWVSKIFSWFEKMWPMASKILIPIGKIGLFFAKWLEPIGWAIAGIQFILSLFHRLNGIGEAFHEGVLNGILFGIKAIGGALKDVLLQPFIDAWSWIKGIWVGKSPSILGLGIVKGLESVGAMIFDALTGPFRMFLGWVTEKIPGMGKFAAGIKGGLSGAIEHKVAATYVPAVTVTPNGTKIVNGKNDKDITSATTEKESKYSLDDLFDQLKQLNDNLMSGKVKAGDVYLDTSLVSTVLARGIEFRGGYGGNR